MVDSNLHIDVNNDVIQHSIIYKNIKQEFILTNMDKVELLLIAHHNVIKRKIDWLAPLGIFITLLATLATAEFTKTGFGIEPIIWKSLFLFACISSFALTVYFAYGAIKDWNKGTVEEFIRKLKIEDADKQPSN
ncbi:hypothetical protein [Mucilaginibacter paludis]|uniref:Uncharacterized protein n=1 Tax=Mucilaginibacter paludis DSM 18603 TaxID=714943 RepID=H1Y5N0_9SPHI|nr:hypothetical protein [Mucilaginibacter paludis]EHQ29806.1 hypothetical protein Mucpa_5738 [Mucilaginibacter paludis DSM 18603]